MTTEPIHLSSTVPDSMANKRLDQACQHLFSDYSRNQLQHWIKAGSVTVDNLTVTKPRHPVKADSQITINATLEDHSVCEAQDIPLDILFEDSDLMIINKPSGLICHPGAGIHEHTLVNGLLFHDPALRALPRAGLIHRLDKDTTGLLIIAKNNISYQKLSQMMRDRLISRHYHTVVHGKLISGGTLKTPYGRHPTARTKMAVLSHSERIAITHYRIVERFRGFTHLEVTLDTGRTHQIRVHMAHLRHPILGDATYGKRCEYPNLEEKAQAAIRSLTHQALHAKKLSFEHPISGDPLSFEAPLPDTMKELIDALPKESAC